MIYSILRFGIFSNKSVLGLKYYTPVMVPLYMQTIVILKLVKYNFYVVDDGIILEIFFFNLNNHKFLRVLNCNFSNKNLFFMLYIYKYI